LESGCTAIYADPPRASHVPFPKRTGSPVIWQTILASIGQPRSRRQRRRGEWRKQTAARQNARHPRTADLADGGDPERVRSAGVTAGFFETLGVTPLLGRLLPPMRRRPAGSDALINHGLWQRRFRPAIRAVGKAFPSMRAAHGDRHLPPDFAFPRGAEWPAFFPFAVARTFGCRWAFARAMTERLVELAIAQRARFGGDRTLET